MFYALRKIITAIAAVCWAGLGYHLYFHPDTWVTYSDQYINYKEHQRIEQEDKGKIVLRITGTVIGVANGQVIQVKDDRAEARGVIYTIGLAGVTVPADNQGHAEAFLNQNLRGKHVAASLLMLTPRYEALGIVYLNPTPINLQMVGQGEAGLNLLALTRMPWEMQEEFRLASHRARSLSRGIWKPRDAVASAN